MKKKSSIKSIVVSRRDMVLTEGTIVYTCDAFGSKTLVIIGPVERLAHNSVSFTHLKLPTRELG